MENQSLRFNTNAATYGYDTVEEMEAVAYFHFAFKLTEDDTFFDDNMGEQKATLYLKDGPRCSTHR